MAQDTNHIQQAHDGSGKSDPHTSFRVCEGRVLVFHRADSPNWSARWRAPDGTHLQLSLRTPDRALAAERATREHMEFEFRLRHGLSVRTTGFGHVCDVMLEELGTELRATGGRMEKLKEYRSRVDRYLRPFFGDRAVDTITAADIARYRDWRASYWSSGPGSKQSEIEYVRHNRKVRMPTAGRRKGNGLRDIREDVALRRVFACAAKHGWINAERTPRIEGRKRPKDNPRAHFTPEEAEELILNASAWVDAAKTDGAKALRQLTTDFVELLFATGMRPSEAVALRWGDIEFFRDPNGVKNLRFWVGAKTKTGRRDVVALASAEVLYLRMMSERPRELLAKDRWLFTTPDGRRVTDFGRLAKRWFAFAGVTHNTRDEVRSLYSCRHTYITTALARGHSTHMVAVSCGTSTAMIDRFYSKMTASMNASILSGRATRSG